MNGGPFPPWGEMFLGWRELRQRIRFWKPLVDLPDWMAPAIALGAVLALAVTTGVALVSLATLLTALLTALLILSSVFGIALVPEPSARRF